MSSTILALTLVPAGGLYAAGGRGGGGGGGGSHGGGGGSHGGSVGVHSSFRGASPSMQFRGGFGGNQRQMARNFALANPSHDNRFHDHFHHHHGRFNNGFFAYSYPSYDYPYYPYSYGYGYGYGNYPGQYYNVPMEYSDSTYAYSDIGAVSVRELQDELAQRGYYKGTVDGVMGPMTRQAITDFQQDNNLRATGRITPALLSRLGLY